MEEQNKLPLFTLILVAVNVLVYFYTEWYGSSYDAEFLQQMGAVSGSLVLQEHEYYRLVTHIFLHVGFEHLANNMVSLLVLGYAIENIMGKVRFLLLYFVSGVLAGVISIVYNIGTAVGDSISCGASGAIYGLTGALLFMLIMGSIKKKTTAVARYLLFIGISLYSGSQDPTIDNAAHIGGFAVGFILCLIMAITKHMEVSYED